MMHDKRKSDETVDQATPAKFPRLFKYNLYVTGPFLERDNNCSPGRMKDCACVASSAVTSQEPHCTPLYMYSDCPGIENVRENTLDTLSCVSYKKKNDEEDTYDPELPRRRKIPMRAYEKPAMDERALPCGFNFWNDLQDNKQNREQRLSLTSINETNTPMEVEKPWDQVDLGYKCNNFWRTELPTLTPADLQHCSAPLPRLWRTELPTFTPVDLQYLSDPVTLTLEN